VTEVSRGQERIIAHEKHDQDTCAQPHPQLGGNSGNLTLTSQRLLFRVPTRRALLSLTDFISFLMSRKRYWLLPLVIFIGVLAVLLYLGQRRTALAPFVYSQALPSARDLISRA
jgi:Family of unknown function (DUF5989)